MPYSLYRHIALSQAPRILGLGDRASDSPTFGCFDRPYWHYKIMDMANVRFQEAALFMALLYRHDGTRYGHNERVREWALAAVDFWGRLQRPNGSFDEVYPFENSFCATSFSTWAMTEALLLLNAPGNEKVLKKAGDWLLRHDNPEVANQRAASALALYNLFLITHNTGYRDGAEQKMELLMESQRPTGFFPEYGGADMGYQSLTLACAARYLKKSGRTDLHAPLTKAARFIGDRLDAHGAFDPAANSRNTQFLFPSGFARLDCADVLKRHLQGIEAEEVITPAWMDDRYCIGPATDYLLISLEDPRT